jgi:hypothetical protein
MVAPTLAIRADRQNQASTTAKPKATLSARLPEPEAIPKKAAKKRRQVRAERPA